MTAEQCDMIDLIGEYGKAMQAWGAAQAAGAGRESPECRQACELWGKILDALKLSGQGVGVNMLYRMLHWLGHLWRRIAVKGANIYERCCVCGARRVRSLPGLAGPVDRVWLDTGEWDRREHLPPGFISREVEIELRPATDEDLDEIGRALDEARRARRFENN